MKNIYVLLQDTPSHEQGEEFYYKELSKGYCSARTVKGFQLMLPPEFVENNPEWFNLKEEKVWTDSDMIEFSRKFTGHKWDDIKKGLQEFKLMKHQNSKQ